MQIYTLNENEKLNVLKLDEPQACVKLIVGLLMVIVCEVPRKGKSNRVEKIIFHNFEEARSFPYLRVSTVLYMVFFILWGDETTTTLPKNYGTGIYR